MNEGANRLQLVKVENKIEVWRDFSQLPIIKVVLSEALIYNNKVAPSMKMERQTIVDAVTG